MGLCMEKEAEDVYDSFYNNPSYGGPDNYYQLNGKPLIVYWGPISWGDDLVFSWDSYGEDQTYGNCFTMRYAAHVFSGTYGWNILPGGTQRHNEVEVVSPGWGFSGTNPVLRNCGDFYSECWNFVLRNPKPRIVMIAGFNDYLERTAVFTTDTSNLIIDGEKWYGHNGQLHPSMYWDMTIDNINTLRGGCGNG
ncbi:MAG: hypothetical protein CVU38_01885 [Chloroflexi bacterium HGW-Chloroflexi-1]|nr:MAG: hypothetical protein CVU38_01885 [Chloroflexi bacterium HGW-Chloroflexi-1]